MLAEILTGTSGYGYYDAPEGWKDEYETKLQAFSYEFELLEVQKTFYTLPQVETCRRWREQAADNFTFTLKAWQGMTHSIESPTWRGNDDELTDQQRAEVGGLRPNPTVREAWARTLERAEALEAPVVLIQCPASFELTRENEKNMRQLLSDVERGDVKIAWEPRGEWLDHPEKVAELCEELELIHTVDLLRETPFHVESTAYVRLHGLNEDRYDYNYQYDRDELETLRERLGALAERSERVFCLFNNYEKFRNVRDLEALL